MEAVKASAKKTQNRDPHKMRPSMLRQEVAIIAEKIERRTASAEEVERLQALRQAGYSRGLYYSL